MLEHASGAMAKASTIDEYLKDKPADVRLVLMQVRRAIGRAIPLATESISYQIPAYRLGTSPVVFFAGWKEHYSLYPASPALVAAFSKELEPYPVSKGTIRFPLDEKVPTTLIARLAKFLFREASLRALAKARPKKARPKPKKKTTVRKRATRP
jgi:uncharacterized protein YdhG (YjbR/CyaY superfamily)